MLDINNMTELRSVLGDQGVSVDRGTARKLVNELQSMIYSNLSQRGGYISGGDSDLFDMFGAIDFDEATNSFIVKFNSNAYARSKVNPRWPFRFLPVLINYGYKDLSYSSPHFQGYQGNQFITDAIKEFNQKYKKIGLEAVFEINGIDASLLYPLGEVPYLA